MYWWQYSIDHLSRCQCHFIQTPTHHSSPRWPCPPPTPPPAGWGALRAGRTPDPGTLWWQHEAGGPERAEVRPPSPPPPADPMVAPVGTCHRDSVAAMERGIIQRSSSLASAGWNLLEPVPEVCRPTKLSNRVILVLFSTIFPNDIFFVFPLSFRDSFVSSPNAVWPGGASWVRATATAVFVRLCRSNLTYSEVGNSSVLSI